MTLRYFTLHYINNIHDYYGKERKERKERKGEGGKGGEGRGVVFMNECIIMNNTNEQKGKHVLVVV